MIDILVSGQPLAIPANLTLTLEQSAAWHDPDNLVSDIIFTFDIPAEPNALILDHAHSTIISHHRRYPCQVLFGSLPIADGQLYVQTTSDELHLSCGITFNPFGIGWGDIQLSDNHYGPPSEIVHNGLQSFKQDWRAFLAASMLPDSNIKFPLFCDDQFSDDEDYSYFRNAISPIEDTLIENRFRSYVNRLFFGADGTIIETPIRSNIRGPISIPVSVSQGLRIFNSDSGAAIGHKVNGYRFAPALRLVWLARQIMATAAKRITGNWATDPRILQLFSQSLCSMDGDVRQYPVVRSCTLSGLQSASFTDYGNSCLPFSYNGAECDTLQPIQNSSSQVSLSYQLLLPVDDLAREVHSSLFPDDDLQPENQNGFDLYDEAYFLFVSPSIGPFPVCLVRHPDNPDALIAISSGRPWQPNTTGQYPFDIFSSIYPDAQYIQLTSTTGVTVVNDNDDIGGYTMASLRSFYAVQKYLSQQTDYHLFVVKAKAYSSATTFGYNIQSDSRYGSGFQSYNYNRGDVLILRDIQVIDTSSLDYNDTPLNIFSRTFILSQHVPNLTNSQFLTELVKFFGLSLWVSPDTSDLQLDFFADIFQSQSLPLDDYIYSERKLNYDPALYHASISPVLSHTSVRPDYILPPVASRAELPDANLHKNRHIFITSENAYLRSVRTKDTNGNLTSRYHWEQAGATDDTLAVGQPDQPPTDFSSTIQVPNMRIVDTDGTPKYLQEIPARGCSPMFDDDYNGQFPMVITQYRGRRLIRLQPSALTVGTYSQAYIEYANPTNYNPDGTVDSTYINLTATGPQSVGEMWLKPYLGFLATSEPFEFTARLPIHTFFTLLSLMRPQQGSPAQQLRWISYRQQRYLPSRITYSITAADTVVATITCHREQLLQE